MLSSLNSMLGRVLDHSGVASLPQTVAEILDAGSSSVRKLRDCTIANLGCSAKVIVDVMVKEAEHV